MISIKLEKRLVKSKTAFFFVPVFSVVLALFSGGLLIWAVGTNPFLAYKEMFLGAFGSSYGLSETVVKTIPLVLTSLAVAVAFRMLLWNIGVEGQFYMGAVAAAGVALFYPDSSPVLMITKMMIAGSLAGALWGLAAGVLRAFWGANEIITTLMLNYIAILFAEFLVYGPWKDPQGHGFPMTAIFGPSAWLPCLGNSRVHLGLVFALAAVVLVYVIMSRTKWGYEIRVTGENEKAAQYAGMNIEKNILLVMLFSGALAGLAGMAEVSGITHRLQHGFSVGYGYTAIIIAWLARLNPWAVIVVAFLFAGLLVGGDQLQITMKLPGTVSYILQGAILFFVLGGELFTSYKIRIEQGKKG